MTNCNYSTCFSNRGSCETIRAEIEAYFAEIKNRKEHRIKFYEIFKYKKQCMNLGCMSIIYFVCGMGYYGVSQFIGKMSGNIHLNVAISGALLLPGTIASVFLLQWFARRPLLIATNFLSGLFMIIVISFSENFPWVRVIVACICNCFFFMSFITVFLYGVELFPTSVRNSVLGFLSLLSRSGQIVAPQVNAFSPTVAGGIFASLAILGALATFPLPETKNTELPSTLEDSNTLTRKVIHLEEDPGPKFIPPQPQTSQ